MQAMPPQSVLKPELSERTMTLNLVLEAPMNILVRSSEVIGKGYRQRLSFHKDREIENVLHLTLSDAICESLRSIPEGAYVLSQPEFLVELPGLVLHGIHVMVTEAKDGIRGAILRFKEILGATNRAFKKDLGFEQVCATHSEKLAVSVLADICMPILNICETLDEYGRDNGHLIPASVLDRAREFQFHTELLKRFIHNAEPGHADAPQNHLTASLELRPLRLEQ